MPVCGGCRCLAQALWSLRCPMLLHFVMPIVLGQLQVHLLVQQLVEELALLQGSLPERIAAAPQHLVQACRADFVR